jgi:hypothetical protein
VQRNACHLPTHLVAMQVAAYTNGRAQVSLVDTLLLRHMMWSRPEDEDRVYEWLIKRLSFQAGDEKQVNYLLSSLFGRTCHSLQVWPNSPCATGSLPCAARPPHAACWPVHFSPSRRVHFSLCTSTLRTHRCACAAAGAW